VNSIFVETGASVRIPFRKMFSSTNEALRDINKYKSYSNVYHSIYWFRETEEKWDHLTGVEKVGANYETAVINKVVLDLDAYEKIQYNNRTMEVYTEKAIEDMRKMEEWAGAQDLMREYRFSGGGFYFIFVAQGHALKLRDFELNLQNTVDIHIDEATIGDSARMMRVTNSYNFKEHRKCFCIPLKREELYLNYEDIKKLARQPRSKERFLYGSETYDFSNHKVDESKIKLKRLKIDLKENIDVDKVLEKYGWDIDDVCDTIKGILSLNHKGNYLRYELIKYFKTIVGLTFEDSVRVIASLLQGEGIHSAVEGQAKYVYGRNMVFNPKKLKSLGYCQLDCDKCMRIRRMTNGL